MVRNCIDLSLYLVTQRADLCLDDFYRLILQTIDCGVKVVQLREKQCSKQEFVKIGKDLVNLLKPRGIPVIINDSVEVALKTNAAGVHLGQEDGSVVDARKILGEKAIIGLSIETLEQAYAVEALDIDYIAASPVFKSPTEKKAGEPWGLDGLRKLCSISRHPVIGIGGINTKNVQDVLGAGAVGVAVISAIFGTKSPADAARELSTKIKKAKDYEDWRNR
jgi:thiamine-phosphate pyrophosphorylase